MDGTPFDSSRDRGQLFEFTIGQGVITGWSEGVATMKKGERAMFEIQAHKAYGERGSPPKIPGGVSFIRPSIAADIPRGSSCTLDSTTHAPVHSCTAPHRTALYCPTAVPLHCTAFD